MVKKLAYYVSGVRVDVMIALISTCYLLTQMARYQNYLITAYSHFLNTWQLLMKLTHPGKSSYFIKKTILDERAVEFSSALPNGKL